MPVAPAVRAMMRHLACRALSPNVSPRPRQNSAGAAQAVWPKVPAIACGRAGEEGGLAPYPPAEIEAADLTGLALELALWGGADGLSFLTPPNPGVLAEAQALLTIAGRLA